MRMKISVRWKSKQTTKTPKVFSRTSFCLNMGASLIFQKGVFEVFVILY